MFDILQIVPHPGTIRVIDVGAMAINGAPDAYGPLLTSGLAQVIGFEPVQSECDKLNATAGGRHKYLPYAIGDGSTRDFHVCNSPMTSSLYEPDMALLEHFQRVPDLSRVVRKYPIQTHRLDDLPEVRPADYLKLDVQGAELDVLIAASAVLTDVLVVHTEVEFIPMYKGQPLFAEVDQVLRRNGFLLHKFSPISSRALKPVIVNNQINHDLSQVLWADAIFVKSFMRFHELPPEKLLKLAVVLHSVYGSFDMAVLALKHYDAKMKTDLWNAYLTRLFGKPLSEFPPAASPGPKG